VLLAWPTYSPVSTNPIFLTTGPDHKLAAIS
jgi:hypothetical protein